MIRDAAKLNDALKRSSGPDHIEYRQRKNRRGPELAADHAEHEQLSLRMGRARDERLQPRYVGGAQSHSYSRLNDHQHVEIVRPPVRLGPSLGTGLLGTVFGVFDGFRRRRG
jgi:hypothetical protein